jgi:hypothetical protein
MGFKHQYIYTYYIFIGYMYIIYFYIKKQKKHQGFMLYGVSEKRPPKVTGSSYEELVTCGKS